MKRFIITILALTVLVSSVFAKPKKVDSTNIDGYEVIEWDIGLSQKYVTCDLPLQLFLLDIILENPDYHCATKSDFEKIDPDMQELLNKYDYYICVLDGKIFAVVYKNDANTVWTLIY